VHWSTRVFSSFALATISFPATLSFDGSPYPKEAAILTASSNLALSITRIDSASSRSHERIRSSNDIEEATSSLPATGNSPLSRPYPNALLSSTARERSCSDIDCIAVLSAAMHASTRSRRAMTSTTATLTDSSGCTFISHFSAAAMALSNPCISKMVVADVIMASVSSTPARMTRSSRMSVNSEVVSTEIGSCIPSSRVLFTFFQSACVAGFPFSMAVATALRMRSSQDPCVRR